MLEHSEPLRELIIHRAHTASLTQGTTTKRPVVDWQEQALAVATGAMLFGWGLGRRSLFGLASTAAGGTLMGIGLLCAAARCRAGESSRESPEPIVEESYIDEASWESFPASDPPPY
jgi:hypothetical protein